MKKRAPVKTGRSKLDDEDPQHLQIIFVEAAASGDIKTVHEIIQLGRIDINGVGRYGRTAIQAARSSSSRNARHVIVALTLAGANVADGTTVSATTQAQDTSDVVGGNMKAQPRGETALHTVMCDVYSAGKEVEALLKTNININARNKDGKTALHLAVERQDMDVVEMLLDKNVDVSIQDNKKRTAFLTAIAMGKRPETLIRLFERMKSKLHPTNTVFINFQDDQGMTALHHAVARGILPLVQELLYWRADITRRNTQGFTALHMLIHQDNLKSINKLDILRCLMEHQNGYRLDNTNLQDSSGRTALHIAVERHKRNSIDVIQYLLGLVDVRITDVRGWTAIHTAAHHCAPQKVLALQLNSRYGSQAVNMIDKKGKTALHHAVIRENTGSVHALSRLGDVNIQDCDGKTALHYAVQVQQVGYFDVLLSRMANVALRDRHGYTALALACCKFDPMKSCSQLSFIFCLYRHAVAYGEIPNMV